jgi:ribokinase
MKEALDATAAPAPVDLWVVGNVLIDLMMKGVAELPRWGEEVLASGRSEQVGGQGANLARAAARLDLQTAVAAVVGDDRAGETIRATFEAEGVGAGGLKVASGQTALAVATVRPDGERAFITDLGCSATFAIEDVVEHQQAIHRSRAIALVGTSNLPGLELSAATSLLAGAREHGVVTLFDPGWGDDIARGQLDAILEVTDVFLPNRDEAKALTGREGLGDMLRALSELCPGTVIVTCGQQGSVTLDGEAVVTVEALPVPVDNAVGAGDVFAAGVLSGLLDSDDAVSAMVRGTAAAASYVSRSADRYAAISTWRDRAAAVPVRRG